MRRWAGIATVMAASAAGACGRTGFPTASDGATATPTASATPTMPPFGSGVDGTLDVSTSGTVNVCTSANASGSTISAGSATGFQPGRLVVLLQMQDEFTTTGSGNATTDPGAAGRWELARVTGVNGTDFATEGPLAGTFVTSATRKAQVCTVPQYRSVNVQGGRSIRAEAWNGSSGGVIAFFVSTSLTLAGSIDATGVGFAGGDRRGASGNGGVTDWDTDANEGGGKGEGVDTRSFSLQGRGCYRNAAGGGNSRKGGGGGGAGGGDGGTGGVDEGGALETDGLPGLALAAPGRVLLGGGGGAAHQDNNLGAGLGGAGGGIVLLFAARISGNGPVLADGDPGGNSSNSDGGGGGGGGGGTIAIRSLDVGDFGGIVRAAGGDGGDTSDGSGPGGGGGGGRLFVPATIGASASAPFGGAGQDGNSNPGGANDGTAGSVGAPL